MESKLNLDRTRVSEARKAAQRIAAAVQAEIERHTTVTIERAVLRLYGVDGTVEDERDAAGAPDSDGVPLPNGVVAAMAQAAAVPLGAARVIGAALVRGAASPQAAARAIVAGDLPIAELLAVAPAEARAAAVAAAEPGIERMRRSRWRRMELVERLGVAAGMQFYVIVATGNIFEDVTQARAAVRQGADIVAVIRTTGQSLLDYVPFGATTEGYGGTYATQENFRIMRAALDEEGERAGRYIQLVNYASGLCMPEIAVMGAFERLDMLLNDAMYGILFRDINPLRTLVDQSFSRAINAFAGAIINTGEDNYLTTADAVEAAHTVLASQFLNEQLGLMAGLREEQLGLGHAFEIDPVVEDGLLMEVAQAQLAREVFPRHPLKYMPPTRYMTGNIFRGHVQNAYFNLVSVLTGQRIHLLGMLTEAIHTPFLADRFLALEAARYAQRTACHLADEIHFTPGGRIQQRATEVLEQALEFLHEVAEQGLFGAIERGLFAHMARPAAGGKGAEGVFVRSPEYVNPFAERLAAALPLPLEEVIHARSAR
jgi:beta-lysine 5,6-aminomutase alpha subunit